MNCIKALLIDDENDSLERLERLINTHCPGISVIGATSDPLQAIALINTLQPQLIFLDVEMPKLDGFGVLEAFPNATFKVVFVTAYDVYALRAIKYSALDYLLKPLQAEELKQAVEKVEQTLDKEDKRLSYITQQIKTGYQLERIVIPERKGYCIVPLDDILCMEAQSGGYVYLHLNDGRKIAATETLQHYEALLPANQFFRVHRSFLVQISCIRTYDNGKGGSLELSNGMEVPVSVRKKPGLTKALKQQPKPL